MAPAPLVLYQKGDNMFFHQWVDEAGSVAFSVTEASKSPNLVIKLHREPRWAQLHTSILGPEKSWFYLGPNQKPGYVCYGNNQTNLGMIEKFRKRKRDGSSSRYFTSQSGKEYKWKITQTRMECTDSWTTLAVWELTQPEEEHYGKLTLRAAALPLATEIMTSLVLNKMAADLGWD
ncbi:hypothetical protein D9756_000102 [Leucocoprinus leucothites]|uniref:DUF6593 domain-containing protein n=1 Tax=Leucocoprinus leucothites TaxID=201217 RepID=A0A8H5GFU9_9AGAR|nr:hypothetical protein D9756_000102 [Leucoagaricus leucothites]